MILSNTEEQSRGDGEEVPGEATEAVAHPAFVQARCDADGLWDRFARAARMAESEAERREAGPKGWHGAGTPPVDRIAPRSRGRAKPPGMPRTRLGAMLHRLDCPEGRVLLTARLAEASLLPGLSAADADERVLVNSVVAHALRLSEAVASGVLIGFVVCWQATGRWPRKPRSVRLSWAGGVGHGGRVLGEFRPVLERLVGECKEERRLAERCLASRRRRERRQGGGSRNQDAGDDLIREGGLAENVGADRL